MKPWMLIGTLMLFGCVNKETRTVDLSSILESDHELIKKVVDKLEAHELQIVFTNLKTGETDRFQVNDSNYFYPASTVKFPIAVLALEKVHADTQLQSTTPFYVEGDSVETTIRKEVTKIFAVSDNDAYNRLFEYLGTDYINQKLAEKGLQPARIAHRLSTANADETSTKGIVFQLNDTTLIQQESLVNKAPEPLELHRRYKGVGYYADGTLVEEPMDFGEKNYLPITVLHQLMHRITRPSAFSSEEQFQLDPKDYDFLLETMHQVPRISGYDEDEYYDGYVKFFLFGDTKERIPEHINIYNKVGYAYGYLTDCAYIKDQKHNVEFLLTATIHVNEDGIFNDDVYEYESLGIPFLAELGRQIHTQLISP